MPLSRNGELLGNIRRAEKSDGRNVGQVTASECGIRGDAHRSTSFGGLNAKSTSRRASLSVYFYFTLSFVPSFLVFAGNSRVPRPMFSVMGLLAGPDLRKGSTGSSP